jgi:hypothetical protein
MLLVEPGGRSRASKRNCLEGLARQGKKRARRTVGLIEAVLANVRRRTTTCLAASFLRIRHGLGEGVFQSQRAAQGPCGGEGVCAEGGTGGGDALVVG